MTSVASPKKSDEAVQFGQRLRVLREAAGLTQAELGERAGGMLPHAVARLERGERSPTWETLLRLAAALGVRLDAFQDDPAPPPKGRKKPAV